MAYLGKAKKEDLRTLCEELGLTISDNLKIIELRDLIIKNKDYDEEFTKELLCTIIDTRKAEERERVEREQEQKAKYEMECLEKERAFELEKLRLTQVTHLTTSESLTVDKPKIEIQKLIPKFNINDDDIGLFLTLFERQLTFLKIPTENFVTYLISVLPTDIAKLIAREPETLSQNYDHIKAILLQRFKLSAEKFRLLFSRHRKASDSTWKDFYFEVRSYFEGWLAESKIESFDKLKDLIITDQIKKKCPPEYRDHFINEWSEITSPTELVEKLDIYDNLKGGQQKKFQHPQNRNKSWVNSTSSTVESDKINSFKKQQFSRKPIQKENTGNYTPRQKEDHSSVKCYGCGTPGFIRAKCPNCTTKPKTESSRFEYVQISSCFATTMPVPAIYLRVNGIFGQACIDTGSSHSIAGETLYKLLKEEGAEFQNKTLCISLADGQRLTEDVLITNVTLEVEGKKFDQELIALPNAINNRTLLGIDFLKKSDLILDVKKLQWFFSDMPKKKFSFVENVHVPTETPIENLDLNSCTLRDDEGQKLSENQKRKLNSLLKNYESVFQPGGGPTPFVQHHINTANHRPVASPPYRLSPAKKELLKGEIDNLLTNGIIEECESPYAAPVVLIPKPNGTFRLCVDYRKLNANTVPDTYPLPRMDDLLQDAKHTAFMSTLDLKSGYHQVEVYPEDRDKTAFVCPFGTFRFIRMPFGLRNAPSTFQRLMDSYRRGLSANTLIYLDDFIVLSSTFEEHLSDLKAVFDRLLKFKLHANREKCNFACPKVKYLGHWITNKGIEVDPEKISAIVNIPPPKTVKQVQSFLQTCSWYRKFIANFAEKSRPLSNLTKKNFPWKWEEEEQKSFEMLKQCLTTSPILQQVDDTKPFVIRTDASSYAIGAVLLQGSGVEEHPIEYASRLLNSAEQNYSTTEREALAVVWALNKFRGYVEGSEITVASDHQPLKWLMSLKSPSGRLARWALQLQSFNLKIEYIPGKANVIADMLSRPICSHKEPSCEICTISIDVPTLSSKDIRDQQMQDNDLKKIIDSFESLEKGTDYANWTDRGYLMNRGVLYRYSPDSDSEEAQLVVPIQERTQILKDHHDAPTAGHYGADGTYNRISKRYFWTGMRKFITEYVKSCPECNRFKASNQKPAGLLQTPVSSQRFETIAIDLFGPLPVSDDGKKWIFIIEDYATKWVELFALPSATAKECAITLLEEVLLRYGIPRRIISDNGTQFVSAVMQQLCYLLNIKQSLIPVYHPEANPVERKNRDLKPRLAILVHDQHNSWSEKLPSIRFALNTAKCQTTGQTAAFLHFGRELRTVDDVSHDLRNVIENDNFVAEITPYLKNFSKFMAQAKEIAEEQQDKRKKYADKRRRDLPKFNPGDKVYVTSHPVSNAEKGKTTKFLPRRDGPYLILTQRSPTTYEIASMENPQQPIGVYHISALKDFGQDNSHTPIFPLRKRGRPRKFSTAGSLSRRPQNQRGRL